MTERIVAVRLHWISRVQINHSIAMRRRNACRDTSDKVAVRIGKQKRYPALSLTVIHAEERGTPKNRKKIDWKLITDLPVGSRTPAAQRRPRVNTMCESWAKGARANSKAAKPARNSGYSG